MNLIGAATVNSQAFAQGGAGGGNGFFGWQGGNAIATASGVGQSVTVNGLATGGDSGGGEFFGGQAGNATATASGVGQSVTVNGLATAGRGDGESPVSGAALASATGTGVSGSFEANANTPKGLYTSLGVSVSASAQGVVDGVAGSPSTGTALAQTAISQAAPAFSTAYQALAQVEGLPQSSDVNPVLAANTNLAAAFGSATVELGLGELGGSYDSGGASPETLVASADLTIDPTTFTPKDLLLGFYNSVATGANFTSLTLDVDVGSTTGVINQTFATAGAALNYFSNNALDLGAIGSSPFNVHIGVSETTASAASGFDFGFLLGSANPYA